MSTWLTIVVSVASGGGLTAAVTAWSRRRVDSASAAETLTTTAVALIEPLHSEIEQLRRDLADARRLLAAQNETIHDLRLEVERLELQIYRLSPQKPGGRRSTDPPA